MNAFIAHIFHMYCRCHLILLNVIYRDENEVNHKLVKVLLSAAIKGSIIHSAMNYYITEVDHYTARVCFVQLCSSFLSPWR